MIAVLMISGETDNFYPLLPENSPVSFLPMTVTANLLSYTYSWINSHISQDKIFVICSNLEKELVHQSCQALPEANIIIEPLRLSQDISMLFASLFLQTIAGDELVTFLPVNTLFLHTFPWSKYLQSVVTFCKENANAIVIPCRFISEESDTETTIDAGKSVERIQGFEFFKIKNFDTGSTGKRLFGKQGAPLPMLHTTSGGYIHVILEEARTNSMVERLYRSFQNPDLTWSDLDMIYQQESYQGKMYSLLENSDKKFTIFLDTIPEYLHNWSSFFNHFAPDAMLYCAGNVVEKNCKEVICFNFDKEQIELQEIKQTVIVKRNGAVTMKRINL